MNANLSKSTPLALYILSAARPQFTRAENLERAQQLRADIKRAGYTCRACVGSWEGAREPGAVLYLPRGASLADTKAIGADARGLVLHLLEKYQQDSALYVAPDRMTWLIAGPGFSRTCLGRLEGSHLEPSASAWTYVPSLATYYVARGGK